MSTLSNVNPHGGEDEASSIATTHDADPRAMNTHLGVSVNYAHTPTSAHEDDRQWYVLRATYGRERQACDYLNAAGEQAYLPMHYVARDFKGQRQRTLRPLLPNILFVYTTAARIDEYIKRTPALSYLHYYYNHIVTKSDGTNPPLTISERDMESFIRATTTDSEHVRLIDPQRCHYRSGDRVRITDGSFRGVEGRVARISGQQRVVVTLAGLCSVATAYIPKAFLERI